MYFVCDIYGRDLGRNMTFSLGQRVQNLSFIHRFFLSQIEVILFLFWLFYSGAFNLQKRIVPLLLIHHIKIQFVRLQSNISTVGTNNCMIRFLDLQNILLTITRNILTWNYIRNFTLLLPQKLSNVPLNLALSISVSRKLLF